MQPFSYLRTLIEMCGITSTLEIQIVGLVECEPVPWTAWSPDLTSLDYFLWGSMKSTVYGTPVNSEGILFHESTERLKALQDNCTYWVMCVKLNTADVGGSVMTQEVHSLNPFCNVDCSMCCTCSVYWHVERTLRCSTAPKPCGSEQEFPLEK